MAKPPTDIDKDWFHTKLKSQDKSVRGLARHLNIDAGAASRMLSGQRKMKMTEASDVARFLGAPVEEVLRHAGVDYGSGDKAVSILLAATIDGNGGVGELNATRLPTEILKRARSLIPDINPGTKMIAAEVRARKGPLALLDDALMFFYVTERVEKDAIGALSVVRTRKGLQLLVRLEHARKTGEATFRLVNGQIEHAVLITASPVLGIMP